MSLKVFKGTDFLLVGGKYVSPGICIEGSAAAVQIKTDVAASITVQRSVNAVDFSPVPDFVLAVNGLDEFNVINAVKGQYIRIASTVQPVSCNVLT